MQVVAVVDDHFLVGDIVGVKLGDGLAQHVTLAQHSPFGEKEGFDVVALQTRLRLGHDIVVVVELSILVAVVARFLKSGDDHRRAWELGIGAFVFGFGHRCVAPAVGIEEQFYLLEPFHQSFLGLIALRDDTHELPFRHQFFQSRNLGIELVVGGEDALNRREYRSS